MAAKMKMSKYTQEHPVTDPKNIGFEIVSIRPADSGKNHTVEQICSELGWAFYFSNSVQQEYKLTGFIDAGASTMKPSFIRPAQVKMNASSSWTRWMQAFRKYWFF